MENKLTFQDLIDKGYVVKPVIDPDSRNIILGSDQNKVLIDKPLLKEIRDLLVVCSLIDKSGQCDEMANRIDSLYPYVK